MQMNFKTNTVNAPLVTLVLLLLIYGVILITVGVYHAFIESVGFPLAGVVLVLLVITWRTGIVNQTKRYWRYRNFDPATD